MAVAPGQRLWMLNSVRIPAGVDDAAAALAGFTSGAAFAAHEEERRGKLEPDGHLEAHLFAGVVGERALDGIEVDRAGCGRCFSRGEGRRC